MKSKDVYLVCFEGDAEENLFAYLKARFCKQNKTFKPVQLKGFSSLALFKREYNKIYKAKELKKKNNENVHFIFFIDGDLDDSPEIVAFIESEGHQHQVNNPNTETILLRMAGVSLAVDTSLPDFRDKSKVKFADKFGKKAHQMKDVDLDKIITETLFRTNFPLLLKLFEDQY
jgi:hypothetical protein